MYFRDIVLVALGFSNVLALPYSSPNSNGVITGITLGIGEICLPELYASCKEGLTCNLELGICVNISSEN
jgi:hypothetical protein